MWHREYYSQPFQRPAKDILKDEREQKFLTDHEKKWLKKYKEQQRIKNQSKKRRKK